MSFFVAFNGQTLYKDSYNTANNMTFSKVLGFVMSSTESQGCYLLSSDVFLYHKIVASTVAILPYVGSPPFVSSTLFELFEDKIDQV